MSQILDEITALLGYQGAIELARGWGGRRLHVPRRVGESHPLALTLGLADAARLVERYAGETLELPAERNALLAMRNAAIVRERLVHGRPCREVAREYGLSARAVRYICERSEKRTL